LDGCARSLWFVTTPETNKHSHRFWGWRYATDESWVSY
jgi:hypothetical protein